MFFNWCVTCFADKKVFSRERRNETNAPGDGDQKIRNFYMSWQLSREKAPQIASEIQHLHADQKFLTNFIQNYPNTFSYPHVYNEPYPVYATTCILEGYCRIISTNCRRPLR